MNNSVTLAEQLRKANDILSPAEKRIARVFLAHYPVAGLESVHRLAEKSNVSPPTVLRLFSRLGIGSYPEMQKMLRDEIAARTSSPLEMYGARLPPSTDATGLAFVADSRRVLTQGLEATFESISESEVLETARLLANPRRRIWTLGGRFSDLLAQYLTIHLQLLRKDVAHVGQLEHNRTFALMDFGPKDVIIAFDYRRYQDSTIEFLSHAKQSKATTVLFTDPWLSPAARHADHVLSCSVKASSPFDSLASAFALVETVIAGVVEELGEAPRKRIEAFDELQEGAFKFSSLEVEENDPTPHQRS